jgi:hypothetical protein
MVTYDTIPSNGSSLGEPMAVALNLNLSEQLYAADIYDVYFLDVGYALGKELPDKPFLEQGYQYWGGESNVVYDTIQSVEFSDSLVYSGYIGDQVEVVVGMNSISYSFCGYAWTFATLEPTTQETASAGTLSTALKATHNTILQQATDTSMEMTITAVSLPPTAEGNYFGPKKYWKNKGRPNPNTEQFLIETESTVTGMLIVKNGDPDGEHRIKVALVTINGQRINLSARVFSQNNYRVETPVSLGADNSISVVLRGSPKKNSYVIVEITK